MTVVVMGATGHTGKRITELLLQARVPVRALARSADKLAPLAAAGAQTRAGDAADAAFLGEAFRGADAVYALLPFDPTASDPLAHMDRSGEAIVRALRASGVRHVVALSSLGAEQPAGTGVVGGLHAQEQRLRRLEGTNVLLLRPASFFDNFHGSLGLIKQQGIVADSIADLAIPLIASRDIAAVAAQALSTPDYSGVVVRELLGPRDISHAEAVHILGQRIGKPDLAYLQLPYDEMAASLVAAGFSVDAARLYVELTRAINDGSRDLARGPARRQHDADAVRGLRDGARRGVRGDVLTRWRGSRAPSRLGARARH